MFHNPTLLYHTDVLQIIHFLSVRFMNGRCLCEDKFLTSLGKHQGARLLDYTVRVY
jgi:hypothetical protein